MDKEEEIIPAKEKLAVVIPEQICGFNFVLLGGDDGKKPIEKAWQKKIHRIEDPELQAHIQEGKNYGVQSNGSSVIHIDGKTYFLLVIDFDTKNFQDKVIGQFKETFSTSSGSDKQCWHLWFASDNNIPFKIKDEKMNTLADVIGAGNQVVGPGSVHIKSGKTYHIVKDLPIAFMPYAEIEAILKPYDLSPKKPEKAQKQYTPKGVSDNIADKIVNALPMERILAECGVDTSKNPTNCPMNHPSNGGKCFSWNNNLGHCFHCQSHHEGWNKYSIIKQAKSFTDRETFDWFAEKTGMIVELNKSRKEYIEKQKQKLVEEIMIENKQIETTVINNIIKKQIVLPGLGKLISEFAVEIANDFKNTTRLFYRPDSREVVQIGQIKIHKDKNEMFTGFSEVSSNEFVTILEERFNPGIVMENEKTGQLEFKEKSMSSTQANIVIVSGNFLNALPQINTIFSVPIPIIYNEILTFPKKGYDKRFSSWLPYESPDIIKPDMPLSEAKEIIKKLYCEFCFQSEQDKINAYAALFKPFIKGLLPSPTTRCPLDVYKGNRERAGKDYCAGITGIVYEGMALEEPPINSGGEVGNDNDELRKKILSALIAGRKRLHFSNNRGHIDNSVFEGIITSEKHSDRRLGCNDILTFDNNLDFSLSGNIGVSFTPDLANRSRFINLFLDIEDANNRTFKQPDLHNYVKNNRALILSAMYSFIRNWIDTGKKPGSVSFASFPHWAAVMGGIFESAGYLSPCAPDEEIINMNVDSETSDMKQLFELCYSHFPETWINKQTIINTIISEGDLFSYFDFNKTEDSHKFSIKLQKYIGRIQSGIKLKVVDKKLRLSRQKFIFTKKEFK